MKYKIPEKEDAEQLQKEVNRYLENGWSLAGNLIVQRDFEDEFVFFQALTKEGK